MKDFHERADGLCRSQDTSELLKLMEEWKETTIPKYCDLIRIVSKWVDYSPVSLLNRRDTHEDSDDEFALWMLHWNTYKDVPKSRSDEWTFWYGDDLSLDGDLTEKQVALRKLVIEVRNAKKRFLLQKTSFRDENPINIDPHCIAAVKNIFSGRDFSYYITLITKFLRPTITDENSLLVFEKLLELKLECHSNRNILSYLENIVNEVTCPVFCLKSLLPVFSQKVSQHHFKECLIGLAMQSNFQNHLTNTFRLLLEFGLDPNSCCLSRSETYLILISCQFHAWSNTVEEIRSSKSFFGRNLDAHSPPEK